MIATLTFSSSSGNTGTFAFDVNYVTNPNSIEVSSSFTSMYIMNSVNYVA
jgi:hypothetical protein